GLSQTGITSIVQGKDGYIWIATRVGLVRFDGMRFVTYNHRNTPALTNDNIWVFL
ncbi:MAG: hypothetical protein K9M80_06380, partial [Candidatus Marinimicrobia bacterium]|nr:hypothetical protein [Candidatus Neomarinimicrobiota bacterium]